LALFSGCSPRGGSGGGERTTDPIYGCTDPIATNYDSEATDDDGSCEYPEDPVTPVITSPESVAGACGVWQNFNAESNVEGNGGIYSTEFVNDASGDFTNLSIDSSSGEGNYFAGCNENKQGSLKVIVEKDGSSDEKIIPLSHNYDAPITATLTKSFDELGNVNWKFTTTSIDSYLDTVYKSFNDGAVDSTNDLSESNANYAQITTNVSIISGENNAFYRGRSMDGNEVEKNGSFTPSSKQDLLGAIDAELIARGIEYSKNQPAGITLDTGECSALSPRGNNIYAERTFQKDGKNHYIRVADFSDSSDVSAAKTSSLYFNCEEDNGNISERSQFFIGNSVSSVSEIMENYLGPVSEEY
jgi:hypothetical protein